MPEILRTPPRSLPFEQRACFIAGQAKSGTTLLVSLLDGHPELLVLPEETAYFPTILTKYLNRSRREQVDYLTGQTLSNVLFGGPCKWGIRDYSHFPTAQFRRLFEEAAFDPVNEKKDLLIIMLETYAAVTGKPLESVTRWVEKTPANRNHFPAILTKFPHAKILLTIRDPRAILSTQIALEKQRRLNRLSVYYCVAHWMQTARLASRAISGEYSGCCLVVPYEKLVEDPAAWMMKICSFLGIQFNPASVLNPTKFGRAWRGNSAVESDFAGVSAEPARRWESDLSTDEIGWVEWHCRDLMPQFGYEPRLARRELRHWLRPIRFEKPKEFLKSRLYSWRRRLRY